MATIYWLGKATAVAQQSTGSIDSVDGTPANNTFTVTIGGVAISQVGTTDAATTAAALVALLNASTHPYFAAVTWTNPSAGNITGVADTAGCPFVAALSVSGAGTGAVTDFSDDTASAGPNHWDTAANWSGGAVPVADDICILRDSSVDICWGLAQSEVDLDGLYIEQTYTGRIGLRYTSFATSADGRTVDTSADEYRAHYLDIEVIGAVKIGEHFGPGRPVGSDRLKLDLGIEPCTITIFNTSRTTAETGKPCVRLLMDDAATALYVRSAPGGVGIAVGEPGETSTLALVNVSDEADAATTVHVGPGTTITTYVQDAGTGTLESAGAVTTVTVNGGECYTEGAFAITTVNVNGGVLFPNSTGTITTLNLNDGRLDMSLSNQARTITTLKVSISRNATYSIDPAVVTMTNKLELVA